MIPARKLTLTFDNGPTPGVTEDVLMTLAKYDVLSTFFVVASDIEKPGRRELLERIVQAGHWVGNHTLTHSTQFGDDESRNLAVQEIGEAQNILGEFSHQDRLFRPYGRGGFLDQNLLSQAAVSYMEEGSYSCVLWNSVPRDWEDPVGWVDSVLLDVESEDWTVVVIHDVATGAMDALPRLLAELALMQVEMRQDFPDSCVPIRRGVVQAPLHSLVH